MDLKVYALLNEKIKELAGGGLTQAEVEKIVTDEVVKIVAGAPEDFDTLKEMSDWISSHEESAASMNSAIQTNANDISALDTNKVDKVDGKSLISDTEIARLAKVTNYDDSGVKADIQTNADNIDTNKTNILTLKKHVTGDLTDSDFSEDAEAVMTKTVPTGMADYAAVKVIGGKTVKRNITNPDNATLHQTSYSNGTWSNALVDTKTEPTPVFYTYKDETRVGNNIINSNPLSDGRRWATFTKDATFNRGVIGHSGASKDAFVRLDLSGCVDGKTYTCSYRISGNPSTVGGLKITEAMIEEGSTANEYLPFGLCNAVVESVVSLGHNMIEKTYHGYNISADGRITADSNFDSHIVKIEKGNMYSVTADQTTYCLYDTYPDKSTVYSYDKSRVTSGSLNQWTSPITGWLVFRTAAGYQYAACVAGSVRLTVDTYTEPFKTTLLLPDSDKSLPCFGYGISETLQNIRDYESGTYTQMVAEVDLGDLDWIISSGKDGFISNTLSSIIKLNSSALCSKYDFNGNTAWAINKTIGVADKTVWVYDTSYSSSSSSDATAFKAAMKGVKLVYELATPVVTDCSDMLHPIRVEEGGTITFTNEHNLDMPNIIVYKKEVSLNG